MLAGILKSDTAIKMSLKIVNAFIAMRRFINENKDIFKRITKVEYKLLKQDNKLDIYKFNKQYSNLEIKYSNEFYDKFIIIDNTLLGASLEYLGNRCFEIGIIKDTDYLSRILSRIN